MTTLLGYMVGLIIASLSTYFVDYAYIDSVWPIIFGSMIGVSPRVLLDAELDYKRISRGEKINHFTNVLNRWWILAYAIVLGVPSGLTVQIFVIISLYYWIVFDIVLNLEREKKWYYISTWEGSAVLDRVFVGNTIVSLFLKSFLLMLVILLTVNNPEFNVLEYIVSNV